MSKVWFVTGSSRGLGRSFVEAALSRGDKNPFELLMDGKIRMQGRMDVAMALSSVSVVSNSLLLNKWKPSS